MGISNLEKIEVVKLFWIDEMQKVTEHDSPVPGCTSDIAKKNSLYEYFHSHQEAQKYIESLRDQYRFQNKSLQLKNETLTGVVEHEYSHFFEIIHKIQEGTFPFLELSKGVEDLLEKPKRRIILDAMFPVKGSEDELPYKFILS